MACNPVGAYDRRVNQLKKIRLTDEIASRTAALAEAAGAAGLTEQMDRTCGTIPEGRFEDVIDQTNIHMDLTRNMHIAERRLAAAVTGYLKAKPAGTDALKELVYAAGAEHAMPAEVNARDAFERYDLYVLDGMPCDETIAVLADSETKVVWQKVMDTHADFWIEEGGDPQIYYILLERFAAGLLKNSRVCFTEKDGNEFTLEVRNA